MTSKEQYELFKKIFIEFWTETLDQLTPIDEIALGERQPFEIPSYKDYLDSFPTFDVTKNLLYNISRK